MTFLISAIKIIFLLGFLIFIHELGHFTVAKLCKVKVNEFAIGFGPAIWKKQGKETKYALRLVPLGGFVSMEGEEERSEDKNSFSQASIPKRIAIVAAGAIVNIVFAVIVFFILIASTGTYVTNEVDNVVDGYASQLVGIQSNDKIVEIEGKKIKSQNDLDKVLKKLDGNEINIKVQRNGEILEYKTKPTEVKYKVTGMYVDEECKILAVEKGSSSEKQGIQANDKLIKVNDIEINGDRNKALEFINQSGNDKIKLTVERRDGQKEIEIIPDYMSNYYLGVVLKKAPDTFINRCINGGIQTKEFVFSIFDNLKMLFTGNVGVDQMMGPVGISEVVAKTSGIQDFVYILALISISLGITNLLPIPALDGGKILILIIEAIRRKPMKEENEINIQLLGFAILIGLSIYVTYNDILRIF